MSLTTILFFYYAYRIRLALHSFPTRRSSDLIRLRLEPVPGGTRLRGHSQARLGFTDLGQNRRNLKARDRKSTRLNSSHTVISYAVFCLKKKTHAHARDRIPRLPRNRERMRSV